MKINIKKGDIVKVITGESKGMQGRILYIDTKKYRAIVEGANMVSKHTKPDAEHPDGGIIKKEASIQISNLMVIDGSGNATRIGRKFDEKTGKLIRLSKKDKEVIK